MKKQKQFRFEFHYKCIFEFKNITEAKKWAKNKYGDHILTLLEQKYWKIKEIKKGKDGMKDYSFTKEIEMA